MKTSYAESGRVSYMLECQGCHGFQGEGVEGEVPVLKNRMAIFLTVPGGREFLVQVPGSAQSPLTDQELADTLNWMLIEFGPADIVAGYTLYGPSEVAKLRVTPLIDVKGARDKLARKILREHPEF